jgi:hypothetical protein
MDNAPVHMCTTCHKVAEIASLFMMKKRPDPTTKVWRRMQVEILRLNTIHDYNNNMNGVDRADQLRNNYSVRHRSRKYPMAAFYFILDLAITNSYVIYVQLAKRNNIGKVWTHSEFREQLAFSLAFDGKGSPPVRGRKRARTTSTPGDSGGPAPAPTPLQRTRSVPSLTRTSSIDSLSGRRRPSASARTATHKLCKDSSPNLRCCAHCSTTDARKRSAWLCAGCDQAYHTECFFEAHGDVDRLFRKSAA